MRNINRFLLIAAASVCLAGGLSGCGSNKNREAQITYRQYGISCLKSGDYENAIKGFQSALDQSKWGITDTEIDICLYKARAQYLYGDLEGAEETYTALIDYKELPEAYYQRGCFYYAIGENEKGSADFEKAIALDPENIDLYTGVVENMKKNGETQKAEEYLQTALSIEDTDSSSYISKGRIYILLEDYDKAVENLNNAVEAGDKNANFYLAIVYTQKGDNEKAQEYFSEYTKSGDASSAELCSMAETLMRGKDYQTALTYLEAAESIPGATDLRYIRRNIIICYENIGDFANAQVLMADYVKDYPDDEEAQRDYKFLKTR